MKSEYIGLVFEKDEEDEGVGYYFTVPISKKALIKSSTLYTYFRLNPNKKEYKIKLKCKQSFRQMIQSILFATDKSLQKGYINCANSNNIDFLTELNKILKIAQLDSNIENYENDIDFIDGENYQRWKLVQELLLFQKEDDENKLFDNIELLNQMKISNNLLSFRNRMNILTKIANLRNNKAFKNHISQELDNEIKEFQKEIDSIPRKEMNGNYIYKSIIDIIRFDDSANLQKLVSSEVNFNFEKKYDFKFDFTNLLPKEATLFELSVYFNAISCYKYINLNYIKTKVFTKDSKTLVNVPKFAFASGNMTMIHFCDEYHILNKDDYSLYLDISIAYQNNHFYNWLLDNFKVNITKDSSKLAIISNNIAILGDLINDFGADMNLGLFQAFDNDHIDILKFLIQLRASNINYGMGGINLFFSNVRLIHRACIEERIDIIELLLKIEWINLNVRRDGIFILKLMIFLFYYFNGMTPLHIACLIKNKEIVQLLLNEGKRVNRYAKNIHDFILIL